MKLLRLFACLCLAIPILHAAEWEIIVDAKLDPEGSFDGDSIPVEINGEKMIFNLYFVDAPELMKVDKTAEQAAHWKVEPAEAIALGKQARELARTFMKGGFQVHTKRSSIRSFGGGKRYYGMIKVGDEFLSEKLVAANLARVKGRTVSLADGTSSADFIKRLGALEAKAAPADPKAPIAAVPEGAGAANAMAPAAAGAAETGQIVLNNPVIVYTKDGELKKLGTLPAGREIEVLGEEKMIRVRIQVPGRPPIEGLVRKNDL